MQHERRPGDCGVVGSTGCERYDTGIVSLVSTGDALTTCIADTVGRYGTGECQATADCATGTLTVTNPYESGTFTPLGSDNWQDINSGKVRDSSSAGGGGSFTSNFELACAGT